MVVLQETQGMVWITITRLLLKTASCPSLSSDACACYCVTYLFLTLVDEIKDRIQDALFSFPCKFSETPVSTDNWGLTALLFQVPYSIWTLLAKYSPKQHDQQSYLPFFPGFPLLLRPLDIFFWREKKEVRKKTQKLNQRKQMQKNNNSSYMCFSNYI